MRGARLAVLPLCLLASCAPANSLQGSLSASVSLDFQSVTIQEADSTVAVSFLSPAPGTSGENIVLEIVADLTGLDMSHGGAVNLTDTLPDGSLRGSVTRAVSGDDRRTFPPLVRGSLVFDDDPTIGAHVTGSFSILFAQDQTGDLGAGQTVYGTFTGTVTNAAM